MAKKQINPIVIVAILAGIFLLGPQLGLFSAISNEPETLDGYKDILKNCVGESFKNETIFLICQYNESIPVSYILSTPSLSGGSCKESLQKMPISSPVSLVSPFGELIEGNISYYSKISGQDIYKCDTCKDFEIFVYCSQNDKFLIAAFSENLLDNYFETFYQEKVSWWKAKLFNIGDFEFKLWMAIVLFGLLLLIIILRR